MPRWKPTASASGTQGEGIDFALLVDGLAAEREQGITIDVAYRFFATEKRKFIVADTPGHEQYTRNMVTGASTADLAVILIDARKGVLTQTRRHSYLAHLIGIKNIVLAVNKMDLIDYDRAQYDAIVADYRAFADSIGITEFTAIPISGLAGDNITTRSDNTPWHDGPVLLEHLETVELNQTVEQDKPFRMAVQWVNRPNLDFRGFRHHRHRRPSSRATRCGCCPRARPRPFADRHDGWRPVRSGGGQAVTLCLADEIDCSRGQLMCAAQTRSKWPTSSKPPSSGWTRSR